MRDFTKNVLSVFAPAILAVLPLIALYTAFALSKSTDAYIRERVVLLHSPMGTCTGVQVKAPSGKYYTLSAAHCAVLQAKDGTIDSENENGDDRKLKVLVVAKMPDLMLLSSSSDKGIEVADIITKYQKVHTITRGVGLPPYRTDGEVLFTERTVGAPCEISPAAAPTDCMATMVISFATAQVLPGSSGGPLLDDSGRLLGIVSMRNDYGFSLYATLTAIKQLLADR